MDGGRRIGDRYRLLAQRGRGGLGEVWTALDERLNRTVAIKALRHTHADHLARFHHEALATASLEHPNIVRVLDYFIDGDVPYMVMELLDGVSVAELVHATGRLDARRAALLMAQVAAALDFAHARGIIHRDVKPGNVQVITNPAGGEIAKVLDFGIAKIADVTTLTATGSTVGTPAFMAPEQATGGTVDARTDVFAAGVTLYYALAGRLPYAGRTPQEVLAQVGSGALIPLRTLRPDLDAALDQIIARAVAHYPDQRFQSADELRRALEHWAGAPSAHSLAPPASMPVNSAGAVGYSSPPTVPAGPTLTSAGVRRRRGPVVIAVALVVGLGGLALAALAAVGIYWYQREEPGPIASVSASAPPAAVAAPVGSTNPATPSATVPGGSVPGAPRQPAPSRDGGVVATIPSAATGSGGAPSTSPTSDGIKCNDPILTRCGSMCVDTKFSMNNCGGCGKVCTPDQMCNQGACKPCEVFGMFQVCGGKCTPISHNMQHCGRCFNPCEKGKQCSAGKCI